MSAINGSFQRWNDEEIKKLEVDNKKKGGKKTAKGRKHISGISLSSSEEGLQNERRKRRKSGKETWPLESGEVWTPFWGKM